jgi:hypothetical protein
VLARRIVLAALLASLLPLHVLAGTGEIRFVEADVDLRADGSGVVVYTVRWDVLTPDLHGFYFQEDPRLRVQMVPPEAGAVDSSGGQYGLSIERVGGGRWDVVLAGGQGVSSGHVTYRFAFATSFAEAGYVAKTRTEEGLELVVFNWAPTQWDEAQNQDHYTLRILTPYELPSDVDPRTWVIDNDLVLTEPWVNQKYRIDYQRGEQDRLRLLFHKDRPGNRFHMRTQFYLPADWFTLAAPIGEAERPTRAGTAAPGREPSGPPRWPLALGGAVLAALFSLVDATEARPLQPSQARQGLHGPLPPRGRLLPRHPLQADPERHAQLDAGGGIPGGGLPLTAADQDADGSRHQPLRPLRAALLSVSGR